MGVCCIVFDIDGMLFEFLMNFYFYLFFSNILCFLRVSCYFQHKKNIYWCKKKNSGGGGGGGLNFFFRKTILSYFSF